MYNYTTNKTFIVKWITLKVINEINLMQSLVIRLFSRSIKLVTAYLQIYLAAIVRSHLQLGIYFIHLNNQCEHF